MVNQNGNKKREYSSYRQGKSHYLNILKVIEDSAPEPLSIDEIRKKLLPKINLSLQGIKKHLNKIVKGWKVIRIKKKYGFKRLLKRSYDKNWNPKVNNYYAYTPQSSKLYAKLMYRTRDIANAHLLVGDILSSFQSLEFKSRLERYFLLSRNSIKKQLKKKGLRLTEANIKKFKKEMEGVIEFFSKDKLEPKISLPIKKVSMVEYIDLEDILVKKEAFLNFLNILDKEMDNNMKFSKYSKDLAYEVNRMLEKMGSLFLTIVRDTNYKMFQEWI